MDAGDTNRLTAAGMKLDTLQLGASSAEFETESRSEVAEVTQRLAAQARRLLLLHSENLSPEIYDRPAFLDAVRAFARRHSQARFLILVQDARQAVQRGHRLIELSRQLSSTIEFRRPTTDGTADAGAAVEPPPPPPPPPPQEEAGSQPLANPFQ